jgi:hypothetical protein
MIGHAFAYELVTRIFIRVDMGVVNLFGDVTYEGGGSINGPFMATLGASAAIVSITAGAGEFLGYAFRPFAEYFADKTGA